MDFVYIWTVAVFARYKPCVYIYLLFRTLFYYTVHRTTIDVVRFCTVWLRLTLSTIYTSSVVNPEQVRPLLFSFPSLNLTGCGDAIRQDCLPLLGNNLLYDRGSPVLISNHWRGCLSCCWQCYAYQQMVSKIMYCCFCQCRYCFSCTKAHSY